MCVKILSGVIIVIAVALGLLATVLPPDRIDYVVTVSRFFDIMLPILAVGALLRYLCSPKKHCMHCCHGDEKEGEHRP